MRQKPKPCDVDFLFLQKLAPVIVSPDKSENQAHCINTVFAYNSFLPPLPPSLLLPFRLPSFPSCPEVIFVGFVFELHCVMTTQSWDFTMESMSKNQRRTKECFFKVFQGVTFGEYVTIWLGDDWQLFSPTGKGKGQRDMKAQTGEV